MGWIGEEKEAEMLLKAFNDCEGSLLEELRNVLLEHQRHEIDAVRMLMVKMKQVV